MPTEPQDIVAMLRSRFCRRTKHGPADQEIMHRNLMWLAADEIERLRAVIARIEAQVSN